MIRTPEHFKRERVKQVFHRRLRDSIVNIEPIKVSVYEEVSQSDTTIDFSFLLKTASQHELFSFEAVSGRGLVDAVFSELVSKFSQEYSSLANLSLVDISVKPIFSLSTKASGSDAKTDVVLRMEVKDHGPAEFVSRSWSVVRSSFLVILEAFQFYINCDKAFHKIGVVLEDAKRRNRSDVAQECVTDLSTLTSVNTYSKCVYT